MMKKSWWVDFSFNYIRYRKRSPENSRAGAQVYEAVLRQKLARGESIDKEQGETSLQEPTFGEFAERWFAEYVTANNKPSTQYARKCILFPSLIPFFGKMRISEITVSDVERYKTKVLKTGLARRTVNEHLLVFNGCVAAAYKWLKLKGAPPEMTWLKCPPPNTDYLSFDESDLILSHADGVIREMIFIALQTGMRLGEIIGLQWSSIDWGNRSITVRHSWCPYSKKLGSPKSNQERHVDMTNALYDMLLKRRRSTGFVFLKTDGKPFGPHCLGRELTKVCKKAGLRHIGWHVLRHTFASHLVMRGAPVPAVQKLLGHSALEMTMRYAHLAPSTLRTAIDLLNPRWAVPMELRQPTVNPWLDAQAREVAQKSATAENPMAYKLETEHQSVSSRP